MHTGVMTPKIQPFVCAMASIALHVTVLGLAVNYKVPPEPSAANAPPVSETPLIVTMFLLDVAAASVEEVDIAWAAPTLEPLDAIELPVPQLPNIEAVAADSFEVARQIENPGDFESAKRLQGLYVKQINARVTRVLEMAGSRRDATPAGNCLVHVIQNEFGEVLYVDMDECQREASERERLANAIRAASPLPAPPEGLAMGSYLTLDASSL